MPPYPVSVDIGTVFALSSTLAVIQFMVPLIAYIPERYRVEYNIVVGDSGVVTPMYSDVLVGSSNISSSSSYTIVLASLQPNTLYNFTIAATNNNFDTVVYSTPQRFTTLETGKCVHV